VWNFRGEMQTQWLIELNIFPWCVCASMIQDSRDTQRDSWQILPRSTCHLTPVNSPGGAWHSPDHHQIIHTQHAAFCFLSFHASSFSSLLPSFPHTHTHLHTFNNLWYPVTQLLCTNHTFQCVCVCLLGERSSPYYHGSLAPNTTSIFLTEPKWIDTISTVVESGTAKTKETRSCNLEVADTIRTVITTLPKTLAAAALPLHSLS